MMKKQGENFKKIFENPLTKPRKCGIIITEREVKPMKDTMKSIQLADHNRYTCSFWHDCAMKPKTIKAIKKYGRKCARAKMKKIIF